MNKQSKVLSRQVLEILNDDQTTNKEIQKQRKNANKKMRRKRNVSSSLSSVLMVLFLFVLCDEN